MVSVEELVDTDLRNPGLLFYFEKLFIDQRVLNHSRLLNFL